jgi:hypothetical protein
MAGSGQHEADWGIEPSVESSDESDEQHRFAPPLSASIKSRISSSRSRTLKLSRAESDRTTRFYELFTVGSSLLRAFAFGQAAGYIYQSCADDLQRTVDSRLGRSENARFLERFRYIIVASQLLNGHVNTSHYDRKTDTDNLFSEDDGGSLFSNPYAKARYWVGSGGFVLATSFLLSWVFRGTSGSGFSKGRAVIATVLSLIVGIFLFTRARRKWLRSLRSKAVEFAAVFVQNCQTFDILASNAVTLIQEVELVSRGYQLYGHILHDDRTAQ